MMVQSMRGRCDRTHGRLIKAISLVFMVWYFAELKHASLNIPDGMDHLLI